jgi:hypothetical protein
MLRYCTEIGKGSWLLAGAVYAAGSLLLAGLYLKVGIRLHIARLLCIRISDVMYSINLVGGINIH